MAKVYNCDAPIHDWFELTYAQYLAIPRSVLQSMPIDWQQRFVKCLNELDERFEWRRSGCWVKFKNSRGRFMKDHFADYERGRRIMTQEKVKHLSKAHEQEYKESNVKDKNAKK